jgi:hypothetical protein
MIKSIGSGAFLLPTLMARVLTMDWAGGVGVVPVACWRGVREKERWFRGARPEVKEETGCLPEMWVLEIGMGSERRVVEGESWEQVVRKQKKRIKSSLGGRPTFELPFEVAD